MAIHCEPVSEPHSPDRPATLDSPTQLSDKGKIMKKPVALLSLFFTLLPALVWASPPVPFSGKVAINGVNFHGQAQFTFAIRDQAGAVHWRNGTDWTDTINVSVFNGRYVVLLGGQGMNPLPASLFADHDELYIRVRFDKGDGQGLVHLAPDQRITAVPYALVAEQAKLADSVKSGAITKSMLARDVLADLNQTIDSTRISANTITTSQLNGQILKYLSPEITNQPVPQSVLTESNATFSVSAEGKFLKYQWKKNGNELIGESGPTLSLINANATVHDGNYSVVVSNDFGSVESNSTAFRTLSDINSVSGLTGWWKFDETNGTIALDSSGSNRDATLIGFENNQTYWSAGKIDGALRFDGTDDIVQVIGYKGIPGNRPRTISAWINTDSLNASLAGWGRSSAGKEWKFHLEEGKIRTAVWSGWAKGTATVNSNQWVHIASILPDGAPTSSSIVQYVNAVLDTGDLVEYSLYTGEDYDVTIGASATGGWKFNGLIDDFRIYDRALSSVEIRALYLLGQ